MGICRKSQKVSAHNFDPKGVKKGGPSNPGPEDPPPTLIGLNIHVSIAYMNCVMFLLNLISEIFFHPKIMYGYI